MVTWTDIGFIVLSIILPPLAVFLKSEEFGKDFVLNCLLSIFGWFPGQLHAVYFVCTYEDNDPLRDALI